MLYAADGGRDALFDELTEMGFADAIWSRQTWARPEIDAADHEPLTTALQRIWPLATGDELVIDVHGLNFVTHRELCAIDELGGADARPVVLRTDGQMLVRLAELLGLGNIRVDRTPGLLAGAR